MEKVWIGHGFISKCRLGKDGCGNIQERIYFELAAPIWGLLTQSSMACARPEIVHKRVVCFPSLLNRCIVQEWALTLDCTCSQAPTESTFASWKGRSRLCNSITLIAHLGPFLLQQNRIGLRRDDVTGLLLSLLLC